MFFYLANRMAGQPPDIWHDPIAIALMGLVLSLVLGIVAILVAIGVGIYQVQQGRTRRKLVYEVLSNAPLVSVNSAVADQEELEIRVKGTLVSDARLLEVSIKNAGKVSIGANDYFAPLAFEFDTGVLEASVVATKPDDLIYSFNRDRLRLHNPQWLQFPKIDLNRGDTFQVNILHEGMASFEVRGRIRDGTIEKLEPGHAWSVGKFIMWTAVSMLLIIALIFLLPKIFPSSSSSGSPPCIGLLGIPSLGC